MFKIDEYPEIKKAYREHNRLKRIVYSLEKKIRPDDKASEKLYDESFKKWDVRYSLPYSGIVNRSRYQHYPARYILMPDQITILA